MAKKIIEKLTPMVADLKYEEAITKKAQDYAPLFKDTFPTQTALLIAIDNTTRFLQTAYDALDGNVTAEYFCLHGPLAEYPDQLLALMVLLIDAGVFYPTDPSATVFSLANSKLWKYKGNHN